jgi:transposase
MLIESASACHPFWVGVDVGKESLSIYIAASNKALTIPNKTSAIKDFLRQYPAATLALEPTGGYETKIITLAIEAGCTVYRVNARRVRAFMESLGVRPTRSTRKPWLISASPILRACNPFFCPRRS